MSNSAPERAAERSYTTIDKAAWGEGPWLTEPDKVQWVDPATDLDCLIVRGPSGALCGYVGVALEHPWHGHNYNATVREPTADGWDGDIDSIIRVHGGLTFADACREGDDESVGICHVPAPGRTAHVWWFGFDCAHSHDISPGMVARDRERGWAPIGSGYECYRTVAYVRGECAKLAAQLLAEASGVVNSTATEIVEIPKHCEAAS